MALPAILLLTYTISVGIQEFNNRSAEYDVGRIDAYIEPYFNASQVARKPDEIAAGGDRPGESCRN